MSKDDFTLMGCFGLFVYVILLVVVASVCGGFATSILWEWFAVPVFDLPSITIIQAIGLHILVNSIIAQRSIDSKKSEQKKAWELCGLALVAALSPLFSVVFGWIVLQLM